MTELISFLRVVHIITAILMAWPFYALVAVNQRVRLGPPLGDRADIYMENIVKNRAIPCFVFQGTVFISGLALIFLRGQKLGLLVTNPVLGLKFVLLLLIAGLLSYAHISLQPRIDALFAKAGYPIAPDQASKIAPLRARRKRLASVCMFAVLTSAMLGMQVWMPFPLWLSALLVIAIGLFTWRAYQTEIPYGWV
ncbi:MAG: hypothetical protein KAJ53_00985 [Anaerolineales bacterium]|nr:hypothetical protein [Anaerolineales bacterium]